MQKGTDLSSGLQWRPALLSALNPSPDNGADLIDESLPARQLAPL
jgi:hypothetical protein